MLSALGNGSTKTTGLPAGRTDRRDSWAEALNKSLVGIQHHKESSDLGRVLRCPNLQVRIVQVRSSVLTVPLSRSVIPPKFHWHRCQSIPRHFPQRIMKCDAGIHEEMFTRVVLSGDTTMFQDIGEHMPTTSAPEALQIKVVCSSKVWLAQKPVCSTTATLMFMRKSALTSFCQVSRPCSQASVPNELTVQLFRGETSRFYLVEDATWVTTDAGTDQTEGPEDCLRCSRCSSVVRLWKCAFSV